MGRSLLRYVLVSLVAVLCGGRDLRPSDHGLAFQEDSSSPPPDAHSFFGGSELPEAKNVTDATWWSGGGGARDAGRDHVRVGLLAASGVCGVTGVVLMAVSGVVFVLRVQKQKQKHEESGPRQLSMENTTSG